MRIFVQKFIGLRVNGVRALLMAGLGLVCLSGCNSQKHKAAKKNMDENTYLEMREVTVSPAQNIYRGRDTRFFQLIHTRLELKPVWKTRSMEGKATLTLRPFAYAQDTLILDAKNFTIHSIREVGALEEQQLTYRYNNRKIYIGLQRPRLPKDTLRIFIDYTAWPLGQYQAGLIKDRDRQGLNFINADFNDSFGTTQMWSQGETSYNSAWFPTIESPGQKMTQEVFIHVDTSFTTLSNGKFVSSKLNKDGTRTDYWRMTKPHSPYLAMIAAGRWTVTKDKWRDSIPVNYYLEPAYAKYAKLIFGNTPEMLTLFSKTTGVDYPWPKFSQVAVREFVTGAMENTSAVVHFESLQHDARSHLDESYEDIVAHELFHHWFGDLVTCESWSQVALNESFATYGEYLWAAHKYGYEEDAWKRQTDLQAYLTEATYTKEPIILHTYKDPEELFDRHRYEKGGLVLNYLKEYLGEEIFYKGIQSYLTHRAYKSSEIHYLRQEMEEASGEDLNWFFDQWFLKSGHPVLNINWAYDSVLSQYKLTTAQVQEGAVFRLPLKVALYFPGGENRIEKVCLEHRADTFRFAVKSIPDFAVFDTRKILPGIVQETKPMRAWVNQYWRSALYQEKMEAAKIIALNQKTINKDTLDGVIENMLDAGFWNMRKSAIELFTYASDKNYTRFKEKLMRMALKDKNAKVRKVALEVLRGHEKMNGIEIYQASLGDSSYKVTAAALEGMFLYSPYQDSIALMNLAKSYEGYRNGDVLMAIAAYYGGHAPYSKAYFFHKLPFTLSTSYSNSILNTYRQFLNTLKVDELSSELPFILSFGRKFKDGWSKVSYKYFLESLANSLKKKEIKEGQPGYEKVKQAIETLEAQAKLQDLRFNY